MLKLKSMRQSKTQRFMVRMTSCKTNNKYSGEVSLDELIAVGSMLDASLKPILDIIKKKGGISALKAFACGLNDSLMKMTEED